MRGKAEREKTMHKIKEIDLFIESELNIDWIVCIISDCLLEFCWILYATSLSLGGAIAFIFDIAFPLAHFDVNTLKVFTFPIEHYLEKKKKKQLHFASVCNSRQVCCAGHFTVTIARIISTMFVISHLVYCLHFVSVSRKKISFRSVCSFFCSCFHNIYFVYFDVAFRLIFFPCYCCSLTLILTHSCSLLLTLIAI